MTDGSTRIVTTHYRYKRPPKKRKPNPAALAMPKIVTAKTPKPGRALNDQPKPEPTAPANDDRKSVIVTAHRPGKPAKVLPPGLLPETPEEHKRRGAGADAMFREMKRRIAEKIRSS